MDLLLIVLEEELAPCDDVNKEVLKTPTFTCEVALALEFHMFLCESHPRLVEPEEALFVMPLQDAGCNSSSGLCLISQRRCHTLEARLSPGKGDYLSESPYGHKDLP